MASDKDLNNDDWVDGDHQPIGSIVPNLQIVTPDFSSIIGNVLSGYSKAFNAAFESITNVANTIQKIVPSVNQVAASISQNFLDPLREQLKKLYDDIDWDNLENRYRQWGNYGWVIFDEMPFEFIRNVPGSKISADRACRRIIDSGDVIPDAFERLRRCRIKQSDLSDIHDLYTQERYKPCAMLLFSLIECELIKEHKPSEHSRRNWRSGLGRIKDEIPDKGLMFLYACNLDSVLSTYFCDGGNFDRTVEGEINRNFLMHGMMCKKVTKQACTKLILLLDAVTQFRS